MVSGWEMVPEVHELLLQHVVVVLLGHGAVELYVTDPFIPPYTVQSRRILD